LTCKSTTAAVLVFGIATLLCSAQTPRASSEEALRHDQAGRQLLEKRAWQAAAEEFDRSLKLDPGRADTYIGLGIARWGSGDRQGAFRAFQRATDIDPKSAEAHYNIGIALKGFGENDRALSELKTALKLKPDYEQAELRLALLLQQSGQADKAIAQYQHVLKVNPRSAEAHNWLGVAYLQKNALSDATAEFRQAIKLKPDYVRAYNNLGSTLAQAGEIAEGIQALEKGLNFAPDDLQLRINLGMALRSKGDADGALVHFKSLLSEHSDSPELQYQYGQTLRQAGDLEGAIQAFEKALELDAEARQAYYGLGQALKEAGAAANRARGSAHGHQPPSGAVAELRAATQAMAHREVQQARQSLEKAIASDPAYAEAYNLLGFVLGRGGDLAGAVEKLNQAVALDPGFADAHYNLGVALWYRGDRSKAAAELDEALRLNPAAGNVYSFRGMTCRETGDFDCARRMLYRAIALSPEAPLPYFDLGLVFLRQDQPERAAGQFEAGLNLPSSGDSVPDLDGTIAEFRRAISGKPDSLKPDQAEAYNVLGRMLGAAGADSAQVTSAFQEAIRLRPDYAEARNNLGLVFVQAGEDKKAIDAFREAIKLRPDYADAHQNLGAVLTTSDAAEAVRELEGAVSLEPRLLKAQYNLALAYEASPRHGPAKAVEQLRKLLAMDAKYPRAEFALGRALLRQGRLPEAVAHLQAAVTQEPGSGEARYQLGLALSRAGRKAEGAAEIQKSREIIAAGENQQAASLDVAEARAALDNDDADQAIAKARRVLRNRTDGAEPYYVLGAALARKGDRAEAITALRKALEIDPGHAQARATLDRLSSPLAAAPVAAGDDPGKMELAETYIREGRFQDVESLVRGYQSEHPQSAWAWYVLGYSLYGQRKIGESIQALARSLQLEIRNADAHKVLGRDLMIIGRFDAARVEFEQGARLNPKSAEMPYNLGKLYSIQDNWVDARQQFENAIRLNPTYMEAYDGLGLALEALGDDDGATANYKKAMELNQAGHAGFASPYVNMSALHNRTGDRQAAREYARKALEANERSDRALFQMAKACEYQGDLAAAADALNRAISINPRVSSYFYVLATVYRSLGKVEESRKAMEQFSRLDRESNELDQRRRDWIREEGQQVPAPRPEGGAHD
jgi:tetratricopeptide (TPR) repeat protein